MEKEGRRGRRLGMLEEKTRWRREGSWVGCGGKLMKKRGFCMIKWKIRGKRKKRK